MQYRWIYGWVLLVFREYFYNWENVYLESAFMGDDIHLEMQVVSSGALGIRV